MAGPRVKEGASEALDGVSLLFDYGPDITVTDRVALWEDNRMRRDLWYFPMPATPHGDEVPLAPALSASVVPAFNQRGGGSRLNRRTRVRDFAGSFRLMNFTDILYGGLKIDPSLIDVGTILTAQTRIVELWNATFEAVTIEQVLASNDVGVLLDFPDSFPFVLQPLQSILFTVAAEPTGPSEVDAQFLIEASGSNDVVFRVIGRRSVIFTIIPSTSKPYVEKLSWMTDIITAYDGSEQRISLSDFPEVELSFSVENHNRIIHLMDGLLWGWQHKIYSLPLWHRATKLTQPAYSSNSVVYMATANCGFHVDGVALLWRSDTDYEAQEILEIYPDRLVFKLDLQGSWGAGSICMATRSARLPADVAANWSHPNLATFSLRFILELPEKETATDSGGFYRGFYVFLTPHNWTSPVQEQNTRLLDVFETESGSKFTLQRQATPVITRNHTVFLNSKDKIAVFRRWLYARRGAATPFWQSTGKADFRVVQRIEAGDDQIVVQDVGYHALYAERMQRQDIRIETRLGVLTRRIIASAAGLQRGTEILRVDTPFTQRIEANQVIMVAFLSLNRLESDTVELEWKSDKLVSCNFNTRTLSDDVTGG